MTKEHGTSHGLLGEAVRAAAMQPTRLGHPRFLDAVSAQTSDFNEVRSSKNPAILGLMWLNFLSVDNLLQIPVTATPNWTDLEKRAKLVFKGLEQPSGYTEQLLHAWRLKVKAAA